MKYLYGKCSKVSFIKKYNTGVDLCEITIDFDIIKIFGDADIIGEFIDKDVQYTTRQDVIDGKPETVICEIALISTIQTVKSVDNIRLIPEGTKRTICNFSIKDVRYGEFYPGCVTFLSNCQRGASSKTEWVDCICIDKESREFNLRIFTKSSGNNNIVETMIGSYIGFDMESTRYGMQTKTIDPLPNKVELSPEVEVAKSIIQNMIEQDSGLKVFAEQTSLMNHLTTVIDGEPGYALVRIASEIYMINAIDSISAELDVRSMKRAALCSRAFFLPHKFKWSRTNLNINRVMRCPELKEDIELLYMLDTLSEEDPSPTKLTYIKIRGLVNDIIDIRRGIKNEKDNSDFSAIVSSFNGLL